MANDKKLRRHQAKYDYFNISIDTPINSNDEDSITLAETLEDKVEVHGCLCEGECRNAPNIRIDGKLYSNVTPGSLNDLLKHELGV